jgi:hypothetical protein
VQAKECATKLGEKDHSLLAIMEAKLNSGEESVLMPILMVRICNLAPAVACYDLYICAHNAGTCEQPDNTILRSSILYGNTLKPSQRTTA